MHVLDYCCPFIPYKLDSGRQRRLAMWVVSLGNVLCSCLGTKLIVLAIGRA